MPKLKTNRSAKKRYKVADSGQVKHRASMRNHILTKKSSKRKSQLAMSHYVGKSDQRAIRELLINP